MLLGRLRELTPQAKRPASGPTLAGAGANSDATVIKCGDSPRASLVVIHACVVQKICGSGAHIDFRVVAVVEEGRRDSALVERVGAPAG